MPHTRLAWPLDTLRQQLASLLPGLVVDLVAEAGSTNTDLLDRVRQHGQGAAAGSPAVSPLPACLRVAEHQTRGRGRQGKDWQSNAGASLTFSLALPLAPADWSGLSLAVGLALAEALDPLDAGAVPRLGIKWPNDLLLVDRPGAGADAAAGNPAAPAHAPLGDGPAAEAPVSPGRKLGGILIETVAAQGQRWAVVGVGLNVRPLSVPVGTPLSWGAASLAELDAGLDAPLALARVAAPLLAALLQFQQHGFAPLRARFDGRDLLRGLPVSTTLPSLPSGVADGVDSSGTLWLRTPAGRQPVASGEVSLRWQAPCPALSAVAGQATAPSTGRKPAAH